MADQGAATCGVARAEAALVFPDDDVTPDAGSLGKGRLRGWTVHAGADGKLTAAMTGIEPPLTVTGTNLADLRRRIKATILRGLL